VFALQHHLTGQNSDVQRLHLNNSYNFVTMSMNKNLATSEPSNNKPLFINFHNIPIYMRFWVSFIYGLGSNVVSNSDNIVQNLRMSCE
jgi:hypothetical protein